MIPAKLADRAVDGVGLVGQLDGDGDVRDGSEFDRPRSVVNPALQASGRPGGLGRRIMQVVDDLRGAVEFLLGDEQCGIDGQGLLKLSQGLVELAFVA